MKNIKLIGIIIAVICVSVISVLVTHEKPRDEIIPDVVYVEPKVINNDEILASTHAEEALQMHNIIYLAKCVEAEAGNQSLLGKRLVVDVILNRVKDERFPDTIIEVINQEGQFAVVSNGSLDKAEPSEETYQAIEMEMEAITDSDIIYFTSTKYIGTPCYKLDAHYFGK